MHGGTQDNTDYVLAGFITQTFVEINIHGNNQSLNDMGKLPIFLRKEKTPRNMIPDPYFNRGIDGHCSKHYFCKTLYKLNYRDLDFYNEVSQGHYFLDEDDVPVLNYADLYVPSLILYENIVRTTEIYKKSVKQLELKYPTLFKRMFVSEEEEQQALQDIQRRNNVSSGVSKIEQLESQIQTLMNKIDTLETHIQVKTQHQQDLQKQVDTISKNMSDSWREKFRATLSSIR